MSNVRSFGATGDGKTDDTAALRHAVKDGDGVLRFPRGRYRIRQTIEIPLDRTGPLGVDGSSGVATVIMDGPGPAFRVVGTHGGTGDPGSLKPNIWLKQRLPTFQNIEITGSHPEADGIEMIETMQSVFSGVLIRGVRNGLRLHKRNRNVLIADCHIYHNTGVGVFLDGVNLHQINIAGNHISYNRLGGIRIQGSEVRNLQITGNDIEYNNHRSFGVDPEPTAEIYIDTTDERASVNEVTVASNTIQATPSTDGANIRIIEKRGEGRPPGLWSITGNVIGNQENCVRLNGCHGIVLSGNTIYSSLQHTLLLEDCSHINVTGNSFRRHTPALHMGVKMVRSRDCVFSGCTLEDESEEGQKNGASLMQMVDCERVSIQGCQFLRGVPHGLHAQRCRGVIVSGGTFVDSRPAAKSLSMIRFEGEGSDNLITACQIGAAKEKALQLDAASNVRVSGLVGAGVKDA